MKYPLLLDDQLRVLMDNIIENLDVARMIRDEQHRQDVKFIEKQRWVDAYGFTCLSPRDWQSLNDGKPLLPEKKLIALIGDSSERLDIARVVRDKQLRLDIEWVEENKWTDIYEYTSLEGKYWRFFKESERLLKEGIEVEV
ncbi:MAG: hypothetical protein J7K94_02000 [Dehalococcoidia bacterium]|nr:hypothetical protein [Dehalococcoidia bacterium]